MAYSVGNGQLNQTAPESVAKTLDTMHDAQMAVTSSASFDGADVSATLHRPNGSPGFSDQEIFSQGGVPRKTGVDVVTIEKEAYNAGAAQNGSLGIGTDGVAACVRADEHPNSVATTGGGICALGFKYLASEKSREPFEEPNGVAQALATCPDSAVAVRTMNEVYDMTHADEVIREVPGDCEPTMQSRMGTGGNQVPLVASEPLALAVANDSLTMGMAVRAITGDHESRVTNTGTSVVVGFSHAASGKMLGCNQSESAVTIKAGNSGEGSVVLRHIVRRLTPVECERLMGFPSNFTEVDVFKMTKDEFIAWSLMMGNIECDIDTGCVYTTRGPGGVKCEPRRLNGTPLNGYLVVSIRDGAVKKQCRIHRIVWIAAHGIPADGMVVDHINNDKTDNRIENLQLLTPAENSTKASKDGLYKVEEDAPMAKLTAEQHDEIRAIYETGVASLRSLARRYGISKSRVSQIIHEGSWTRIPYRGKPADECPDSPRYKALGNSWATNCAEWVLRRIVAAFRLGMI